MEKIKVLKISKEGLESSIAGLSQLKPVLQHQVKLANSSNKKQGEFDAEQLGKHFDTAINAMVTVLAYMEANTANKSTIKQ